MAIKIFYNLTLPSYMLYFFPSLTLPAASATLVFFLYWKLVFAPLHLLPGNALSQNYVWLTPLCHLHISSDVACPE